MENQYTLLESTFEDFFRREIAHLVDISSRVGSNPSEFVGGLFHSILAFLHDISWRIPGPGFFDEEMNGGVAPCRAQSIVHLDG